MDWFAFLLLILLLSGVALFLLKQLCHRGRSGYNEILTTAACCGDIQICEQGDTETHTQGEGNSSQCLVTLEKTTTQMMQPHQLFVKPLRPLQVRPVRANNQLDEKHKHIPPSISQTMHSKHQQDLHLASSRGINLAPDKNPEREAQKSHQQHQQGFEAVDGFPNPQNHPGIECGSLTGLFGDGTDLADREDGDFSDVWCPVCQLPLPNETTRQEQTQHFTSTPQVICQDCWPLVGMI